MFLPAGEGGLPLDGSRVPEEHVSDGLEHRPNQRRRNHVSAERGGENAAHFTGLSGVFVFNRLLTVEVQ